MIVLPWSFNGSSVEDCRPYLLTSQLGREGAILIENEREGVTMVYYVVLQMDRGPTGVNTAKRSLVQYSVPYLKHKILTALVGASGSWGLKMPQGQQSSQSL